ncbi:MAG: hypothetical protein AB9866_27020 [Syntrophobacteraceae bacterium]
MLYDEFSIELAHARNAPEPEANAERANGILELIDARRIDRALARLPEITDPGIRRDLEQIIEFNRTCRCIPLEE